MVERAGVSTSIRVDDDGFGEALERMLRLVPTLQPVMEEFGGILEASSQERFEDEKDPEGNPWPRLSDATLKQRGDDAKILRDRGHLVQSITSSASRLEVAVGSNKTQARIHQLGGQAGRGKSVEIPARPYLGVSADDRTAIGAVLGAKLSELVG